ncbi:MAG: SDR family NAD(P)-dependent oxidoreductase [Chloroflexales bacterium]|nr:SDR family NAD(P)-dependent oxidoreductase [Chloroflexales bacterium]
MATSPTPVVLLTGASAGLGRATAELLAANGFRVFGTSRTPQPDPSRPYVMLPLDVRSDESVQACIQRLLAQAGRIDVLINNAGFGLTGALEEASLDQVKGLFETNFFGAVRMVNAVLPTMRRQHGGSIVNISSIAGIAASPFLGFYSASKHALEGYSEALRHEVKAFNIRVALIEPGFFPSDFVQATQGPDRTIAEYAAPGRRASAVIDHAVATGADPHDIARLILGVLRSRAPRLRHLVGADARLFALARRLEPEPLFEQQARWTFRLDDRPLVEALSAALLRLLGVWRPRRAR